MKQREVLVGQVAAETASGARSFFTTFTFDDAHLPDFAGLADWQVKQELGAIWDKLRKRLSRNYGDFRHATKFERGRIGGRLHLHACLWGDGLPDWPCSKAPFRWPELWPEGLMHAVDLTVAKGRYFARYLTDADKPALFFSKSPALGEAYFERWLADPVNRSGNRMRSARDERGERVWVPLEGPIFDVDGAFFPMCRKWRDLAIGAGYMPARSPALSEFEAVSYIAAPRPDGRSAEEARVGQEGRVAAFTAFEGDQRRIGQAMSAGAGRIDGLPVKDWLRQSYLKR